MDKEERYEIERCEKLRKELEAYAKNPVPPCSQAEAHKLLRQFEKRAFGNLYGFTSYAEYYPAVSAGVMRLGYTRYPHDEAICYAKELVRSIDEKQMARSFLYGLAHKKPAYCAAISCYYFVKALPAHDFEPFWAWKSINEKFYCDTVCEICGNDSSDQYESMPEGPAHSFYGVNRDLDMFHNSTLPLSFGLTDAILYLEEYKKLPAAEGSREDYEFFKRAIAVIEELPENAIPPHVNDALRASGFWKFSKDRTENILDIFGYLDILHTKEYHGFLHSYTRPREREGKPYHDRCYYAYPVHSWRRKDGIDYKNIEELFGNLY